MLIALIALLLLAASPAAIGVVHAQSVVSIPNDEAAMVGAIETARASLPLFWAALEKPSLAEENFAVKLAFDTRSGTREHIWAVQVARDGERVSATIDTAPRDIPDLKHGQRVTVPVGQITDWFFFRDGRLVGGQTIRVLLPLMPEAEARKYRAILAPE